MKMASTNLEIVKKKALDLSKRLVQLKKLEELTWNELAEKLGVGISMLMMVKRGERQLSNKVMVRLEWAEVEAGIKPESEISEAAREIGRKVRPIHPEIAINDVEKGFLEIKPEYSPDAPTEALPATIILKTPRREATRQLMVILAKSFDFDIVLLSCLEPKIRSEEFLDQLDIASRQFLRDAAMTLVFGLGWRSMVANLVVESRIGPSSVIEKILGK